MAQSDTRRAVLRYRRQRQLELMAAFCRFWGMTPAEYKALTIEELDAMTAYANRETEERKKQERRR